MKSKAPLALMEQLIMLLVFALTAALCLQAFVKSDHVSRLSKERDQAVIAAQSAAETIRSIGGSEALAQAAAVLEGAHYSEGILRQNFEENGKPVEEDSTAEIAYVLTAENVSGTTSGLYEARIRVYTADGEDILFEVPIAWQAEEGSYGEK